MTALVLGIISALIPLLVIWIRRKMNETPKDKLPQTYDTVAKEVSSGNANAVNARLDDVLNRVHTSKGNISGQGSGKTPGK